MIYNYSFMGLLNEPDKLNEGKEMTAKEWWELEKELKVKLSPAQKKVRDLLHKGYKIWIINKHRASGGEWMWKKPNSDDPEYAGVIFKPFNNYIFNMQKLSGKQINTPKDFFYTPTKKVRQLAQGKNESIDEGMSVNFTTFIHTLKPLEEAKSDYPIYNDTYGGTIDEISKYAKKKGFDLDESEVADAFMDAFFKPRKGKTKRDNLTLLKNGKEQKKKLHVQIFNRGTNKNTFELNMYIS